MEKICKGCNKKLSIEEFYKSKAYKDGRESKCKECRNNQRPTYPKVCKLCKVEFETRFKTQMFCSNGCKFESKENKILVECRICNKEFEKTPSQIERSKYDYCSVECKHQGQSLTIQGENHPRYSQTKTNCHKCGKEIQRNAYEINEYKRNYCSNECRFQGYSKHYSGADSPFYDHNRSEEERIQARQYPEYKDWRLKVFERDEYTCKCCEDDNGGNLNAHHIYNYMEFEELRTKLSNGITLCNKCHKGFHDTYGYKDNDKYQLNDFLNNILT